MVRDGGLALLPMADPNLESVCAAAGSEERVSTARLILVRLGALVSYLGAHWAGANAIDAWGKSSVGMLDLAGSTCAALVCAAACGWFLLFAWRGYRAQRSGSKAGSQSMSEAIRARAMESRPEGLRPYSLTGSERGDA